MSPSIYRCQVLTGDVSTWNLTCNWLLRHWDVTFSAQGHSFDCFLRHQSTYRIVNWYDPHAEFWLFCPPNESESDWNLWGGLPPTGAAPKKHLIALTKDLERLRDSWLKVPVRRLAHMPLFSRKDKKQNSCGASKTDSELGFSWMRQALN